jgi:dual specificity phosphatase 12
MSAIISPISALTSPFNGYDQNGHFPLHSQSDPAPSTPGVPLPRQNSSAPGFTLTMSSPEAPTGVKLISDVLPGREPVASPNELPRTGSVDSTSSASVGVNSAPSRPLRSAAEINASLPPHLLALRGLGGPQSSSALSSPFHVSPNSSPERETSPNTPHHVFPTPAPPSGLSRSRSQSSASGSSGTTVGRKMSLLAMTPADGARERRGSSTQPDGGLATSGPPILVNPKCSGYFVEPVSEAPEPL